MPFVQFLLVIPSLTRAVLPPPPETKTRPVSNRWQRASVMVSLLTRWNRHAKPILRGRKRACRVRRKRARRINELVEIKPDFSRLRQAVIGKFSVKKSSRAVGDRF